MNIAARFACTLVLLGLAFSSSAATPAAPELTIYPTQPVLPEDFAKLKREDFAAGTADVHAVFAYEAKPVNGITKGIYPIPGERAVPTIDVHVAVNPGKPVMVVLGAYNSTHWKLAVDPGVKLVKVITTGYYRQYVSGIPRGTRVITYYHDATTGTLPLFYESEEDSQYPLFENLRRLTSKRVSTLQMDYALSEVTIDGVKTLTQPPPDSTFDLPRPTAIAQTMRSGCRAQESLVTHYCAEPNLRGDPAKSYSTVKANRAFTSGKVYFEAKITLGIGESQPRELTNIGLMAVSASEGGLLLPPYGHLNGLGLPLIDPPQRSAIKNGDIIGVAADLNRGRLYFRINDKWRNGDPDKGSGGMPIPLGDEYVAAASMTAWPGKQVGEEGWEFNFGGTLFARPVPQGYAAYALQSGGIDVYRSGNENPILRRIARAKKLAEQKVIDDNKNRRVPISAAAEIHAIGIYEGGARDAEGNAPQNRQKTTVNIKVTRSGAPIVLVLMAYEAVHWSIEAAANVSLEKIVVAGYEGQSVAGIGTGIDVLIIDKVTNKSDPRGFPTIYYGKPENRILFDRHMRNLFARDVKSFQGAYRATAFVIDGESRLGHLYSVQYVPCNGGVLACKEEDTHVMCDGRKVLCE